MFSSVFLLKYYVEASYSADVPATFAKSSRFYFIVKISSRGFGLIFLHYVRLRYYSTRFPACQENFIPIIVSPCAGAVGPAADLSHAAKISRMLSGERFLAPTSISVPAMIRTIL